jgi:hypothetical protein
MTLTEIACAAKVPGEKRAKFERQLTAALRRASAAKQREQPRARNVRPYFARLRKALLALQSADMKPNGSKPDWHGEAAGAYVEAVAPGWIANALQVIEQAESAATTNKKTRLPGGRSASSVKPAFRMFLYDLFIIERACGFRWSAYDHDGVLKGSLITALDLLQSHHLPAKFIPSNRSTLRKAIEAVRRNMRKATPNSDAILSPPVGN